MRISVHNSDHGWNFWKIPSQLELFVKNLGCGEVLSQFGPSCGLWEAQTCGKCKKNDMYGPLPKASTCRVVVQTWFFWPKVTDTIRRSSGLVNHANRLMGWAARLDTVTISQDFAMFCQIGLTFWPASWSMVEIFEIFWYRCKRIWKMNPWYHFREFWPTLVLSGGV